MRPEGIKLMDDFCMNAGPLLCAFVLAPLALVRGWDLVRELIPS